MPIALGAKAPDFTLKTKTAEGLKDVRLSDRLGQKQVVLLFFPFAFTPVCTVELCDVSGGISSDMPAAIGSPAFCSARSITQAASIACLPGKFAYRSRFETCARRAISAVLAPS